MNPYRNPIQVNVFPYRNQDSRIEFLLMRRLPHGGGFWQGVSGGVLVDEEVALAAKREVLEETGFEADVINLNFTYSYPVEEKDKHRYAREVEKVIEHAFVVDVSGQGDPALSREHDAFKWQCFEDVDMEDLRWPNNQEALRRAYRLLKYDTFS